MARSEKEAIVMVVDVGPSMSQAPPGVSTSLQTTLNAITMIIQRKIFAESKDELALVLFGTPDTSNELASGEDYANISVARPLSLPDWDLLEFVQNDIQSSDVSADVLDAIVVGMDHLKKAIVGKKGIVSKRLLVFSDLGGEFSDDQLSDIIGGLKQEEVNLNIVGPNLGAKKDSSQGLNGHQKQKTAQQRSGLALVRHLAEQVDGECYSFSEVIPAISFFQSRVKKPTPVNYELDFGAGLQIPVGCYIKTEGGASKVTFKSAYARDIDQPTKMVTSYHLNDDDETEVESQDIVKGYRYGSTLVPFSKEDSDNMKFETVKSFKVNGYVKRTDIPPHFYIGKGCRIVMAKKDDEPAAVALSSFINAMYETDTVAIARQVFRANCQPKLGFLSPIIKSKYECLVWIELPFVEDVRRFTFASLPVHENVAVNKKFKPSGRICRCRICGN